MKIGRTPAAKMFTSATNVPTGGLSVCDSIFSALLVSGLGSVVAVAVAVAVAAGSSTGTT